MEVPWKAIVLVVLQPSADFFKVVRYPRAETKKVRKRVRMVKMLPPVSLLSNAAVDAAEGNDTIVCKIKMNYMRNMNGVLAGHANLPPLPG